MKLPALELGAEDRAALEEIVRKASDWRMRERAQTVLHFGNGLRAKEIVQLQNLNLDTVYDRRKFWLADGVASLADKPRSGAPAKLSEAQRERLRQWATTQALTSRQLLDKLKAEFDVDVHPFTLSKALKKMGFVWKRTRHSLKKKRNEVDFRAAKGEIDELIAAAQRGEIELAFCDEAGFAQAHPNRGAWTPVGEVHASDAQRGKRLNVVGALLSSGTLFSARLWVTMTAQLFVGFLGLLMEHVGKPLVVILDNASVHKAKEIAPLLDVLQRKGLKLYFLPPYSPELNRIEKLWHKMKYEWMAFKSRDTKTLEADVSEILDGFGVQYKMDFC
jgi:transposase